jgi:hypothetical protein
VIKLLLAGEDYPDGQAGRGAVAALAAAMCSAETGNGPVRLGALGEYHSRQFPWA